MEVNEAVKVNADASYGLMTSDAHHQERETRQMCGGPPWGDRKGPFSLAPHTGALWLPSSNSS